MGGTSVSVVAIPMKAAYEIPEAVQREIGKYKEATFRRFNEGNYFDGYPIGALLNW
jgi:hypothetical protein